MSAKSKIVAYPIGYIYICRSHSNEKFQSYEVGANHRPLAGR